MTEDFSLKALIEILKCKDNLVTETKSDAKKSLVLLALDISFKNLTSVYEFMSVLMNY